MLKLYAKLARASSAVENAGPDRTVYGASARDVSEVSSASRRLGNAPVFPHRDLPADQRDPDFTPVAVPKVENVQFRNGEAIWRGK